MQFLHNVLYCSVVHIPTILCIYNTCISFQLVLTRQLNNKLEYLVQYIAPISYAGSHKYGLFCLEIVLYFSN